MVQINNLKPNDVIKILSLNGTTLITRIAKNDFEVINLQQFQQGSYIIKLQNNAGVKHKIVMKL